MPISLEGIALPEDIEWSDEFNGFGVGQQITPTLTGALLLEEVEQTEGRPMRLQSGDGSWVHRSVVEALAVLAATPLATDDTLSLVWSNGRTFDVVFDHSGGNPFTARQVYRLAAKTEQADHPYFISLSLFIKDETT